MTYVTVDDENDEKKTDSYKDADEVNEAEYDEGDVKKWSTHKKKQISSDEKMANKPILFHFKSENPYHECTTKEMGRNLMENLDEKNADLEEKEQEQLEKPVSYTHLTLPTNREV